MSYANLAARRQRAELPRSSPPLAVIRAEGIHRGTVLEPDMSPRPPQTPTELMPTSIEGIAQLPDLSYSCLRPALALSARAIGRITECGFGTNRALGSNTGRTAAFENRSDQEAWHWADTPFDLVTALAAGAIISPSRFTDILNSETYLYFGFGLSKPELLRKADQDLSIEREVPFAGVNNTESLILIANAAALWAATGAARFVSGEYDGDENPEQPTWLWAAFAQIKLSLASSMAICGLRTSIWGSLQIIERERESTRIALKMFKADFAFYDRLTKGQIRSKWGPDLLGGPIDASTSGPFGQLWPVGSVPAWITPGQVPAIVPVAQPIVTDVYSGQSNALFSRVEGTDAYCVMVTADDDAVSRVDDLLSEIGDIRQASQANSPHPPLLIVHGPDLPPELAGKLTAAGAYYIPALGLGGTEPKDVAELCEAVGRLLGNRDRGSGNGNPEPVGLTGIDPAAAGGQVAGSPADGWISGDEHVTANQALLEAQARYRSRVDQEYGWPVGP